MTKEERSAQARIGGIAVSRNRAHMAAIGRKGGRKLAYNPDGTVNRDRMSKLGSMTRFVPRNPNITPENIKRWVELREIGKTFNWISQEYKVSITSVRYQIRKYENQLAADTEVRSHSGAVPDPA